MMQAPKIYIRAIELKERPVRLRLPFRFGVVTLTQACEACVRVHAQVENMGEATGYAAEMMIPKWFDKNPVLSNEANLDQLRMALHLAREAMLGEASSRTGFAHFAHNYEAHLVGAGALGLNPLTASYGPALIDRAIIDALCRVFGVSFYGAVRGNLIGLDAALTPDLAAFNLDAFLAALAPAEEIALRHTVGLADAISDNDLIRRVDDGLPETLEQVLTTTAPHYFKIKLSGKAEPDMERLTRIAGLLDRADSPYWLTLDGNEQFDDIAAVIDLWEAVVATPKLARLAHSVLFLEQPLKRDIALSGSIEPLAKRLPAIIDESDATLDSFLRARELGYAGVSSKSCKGVYKSLLNAARCAQDNARGGGSFMSAEDLTTQPGLSLQQDLALANVLGLRHVERNGHHYVNGMADVSEHEAQAFLRAHDDLYENSHGAVRLAVQDGMIALESLACTGFASAVLPDWATRQVMRDPRVSFARQPVQ